MITGFITKAKNNLGEDRQRAAYQDICKENLYENGGMLRQSDVLEKMKGSDLISFHKKELGLGNNDWGSDEILGYALYSVIGSDAKIEHWKTHAGTFYDHYEKEYSWEKIIENGALYVE